MQTTVTLSTKNGPKSVTAEAYDFAPGLVIHKRLEDMKAKRGAYWNVTHVGSGLAAFHAKSRTAALRILKAIGTMIDWTQDPKAIYAASGPVKSALEAAVKKAGGGKDGYIPDLRTSANTTL